MYRTIIALLLAAAMMAAVVGCTGAPGEPRDATEAGATGATTATTAEGTTAGTTTGEGTHGNIAEIIKLPGQDENTKVITIQSPENLDFASYVKPNFTDYNNFTFGDYMPFVKYAVTYLTNGSHAPVYEYAFLGHKSIGDLSQGNMLYNAVNDKYKVKQDAFDDLIGLDDSSRSQSILKYYYESRIIYISEDGERVANLSLLSDGKEQTGYSLWKSKIDIYRRNEMIHSIKYPENERGAYRIDDRLSRTLFDLAGVSYYNANTNIYAYENYADNIKYTVDGEYRNVLEIPNNSNKLLTAVWHENILYIHSLDDLHLDYVVNIPLYTPNKSYAINQFLNDKYLVISHGVTDEHSDIHNYYFTYLFNLETLEMNYLGNFMYNPVLSPDFKYIIYTANQEPGGYNDVSNLKDMGVGFYIKNLEINEIVYYPVNPAYNGNIDAVNWVNKRGIEGLIGYSLP